MTQIARKTRLAEHLDCMKKRFRRDYSFYPSTFILPRDKHNMKKVFDHSGKSKVVYIVKPDGGCQGRGIFLTKDWETIESISTTHVAQRYISDPMLIDNKKFDLRIYILITSCDPLRIYLFQDGLVRLCTQDFVKPNLSNLDNTCMHLSNYSINKRSGDFSGSVDSTGSSGSKRSVKWFLSWLAENRGKDEADRLWCKIEHICVMTILSIEPILVREYKSTFGLNRQPRDRQSANEHGEARENDLQNKFPDQFPCSGDSVYKELKPKQCSDENKMKGSKEVHVVGSRSLAILGFDIMVDSKLKPHLIEVNHLPSFATDSPLDEAIKSKVVLQALSIIQAAATDKKSFELQEKASMQKRLFKGVFTSSFDDKVKRHIQETNDNKSNTPSINNNDKKETLKEGGKCDNIEQFVTEIYSMHAPEKIDKVHLLLQKYQGHEEWLVKKLKEKYCPDSELHENDETPIVDDENKLDKTNLSLGDVENVQGVKLNSQGCNSHENSFSDIDDDDDNDDDEVLSLTEEEGGLEIIDENMTHEDNILVTNGNYKRIYPPVRGRYKAPSYKNMMKHAAEEDFKRQMRLVCPLWQLRKFERDENTPFPISIDCKQETSKNASDSYYSRGDWLVHGNIHKKSESIPKKVIQLPSQKQILAAERLSRGYSVECSESVIFEGETCSQVDRNDFVTRLSLAEQAGKEIRKKNEDKFVSRSQLNINPVNIAFGSIPTASKSLNSGERCYVDFTGRKL